MEGLLNCPLCGAEQGALLLDAGDPLSSDRFELRRCPGCGLVYVSPRPDEDRMRAYYPDGYFGKRHPVFKDFFMGVRVGALDDRPAGRVLDIGCGRGDFLAACRRRGWDVVGVEQADAPVMELRRTLGFDVVTMPELAAMPDASFDAVTMWHVFEHMVEPRATLRQAHRLLRAGGTFVAEVPNFGSWQARLGPAQWFHLDVPRHLIHFERATLDRMLDAEGFAAEKWSTFSVEYDAFGLMQSLLNRVSPTPNWLFQKLIGQGGKTTFGDVVTTVLLVPILGPLSWLVSAIAPAFGQGGVLRVTARKKG